MFAVLLCFKKKNFFFLIAQVMLITHDRCMIDEIKVIW